MSQERTPLSEIQAAYYAFLNRSAQCQFPARFIFLKKFFPHLPNVQCKKFEDWKKQISGDKVSFVFASQYITNPISSFGHIFLRFSSGWMPENMDPTFSYAANIPPDTPTLIYAAKGIFGGFDGEFAVMPAYYHIHTYNNLENRDLWYYDLKLNKHEVRFLVAHLWELTKLSVFDYYFFDHNCAGILLMAIEAVLPKLNLYPNFTIYLSPSEATKIAYENGLVEKITYVPSLKSRLEHLHQLMNNNEKKSFKKSYQNKSIPHSPLVLDAMLEKISLDRYSNEGKLSSELEEFESKILVARSKSKVQFKKPTTNLNLGPHKAHPYQLLKIEGGHGSKSQYNLSYRPAAHGLLDQSAGFLPNSEINVLKTQIGYSQNKVFLDRITFLSIANFTDWPEIGREWSWSASLSLSQDQFSKPHHYHGNIETFFGAGFGGKNFLGYYGVHSNILPGSSSLGHYTIGPQMGALLTFSSTKVHFETLLSRYWGNSKKVLINYNVELRQEISNTFSLFFRASHWRDLLIGKIFDSQVFIGPGMYF